MNPLEIDQKRVVALLLSLATRTLFPGVTLCGSGLNTFGFFADFIFSSPFSNQLLELIEQTMIKQVKEELPVRSTSMMRENAQGMFEHFGLDHLADEVAEREENVVDLMMIGDFYGLSPSVSITSLSELGRFKLHCFREEQTDEGFWVRIEGVIKENASELKSFLKTYQAFLKKKDHRILGPQLKLFEFYNPSEPFEVIWTSKGLKLKEILISRILSLFPDKQMISTPKLLNSRDSSFSTCNKDELSFEFCGEVYFFRSSLYEQHRKYLENLNLRVDQLPFSLFERTTQICFHPEAERWGLFNRCSSEALHMTTLCQEHQVSSTLISSLHSIEQIITMFAFKAEWVLTRSERKGCWRTRKSFAYLSEVFEAHSPLGNVVKDLQEHKGTQTSLQLFVYDQLERKWPIASLSVEAFDPSSRQFSVSTQCVSSIEALIALLIEETEGELPLWAIPEQFRIIVFGENNESYAHEVKVFLEKKGLRGSLEKGKTQQEQSLRQAGKEKVPYVLLIGEKERLNKKVTVRANHDSSFSLKGTLMDVEEFDVKGE